MVKASKKAFRGISVLLSALLCFSLTPFASAYAAEQEDDDLAGAADWVTNIEMPATCEEIDWDSVKPGIDYEPGTLLVTFKPNTSLTVARAFVKSRG